MGKLLKIASIVVLACGIGAPVSAQEFPNGKTITIVAPFAPGGASDVVARALADGMGKRLKAPVIVENRAGAGGTIGVGLVVAAEPNGYTLVLGGNGSMLFTEAIYQLNYSVLKDLRAIGLAASAQSALVVSTKLKVDSFADFIARSKAGPPLTYGSPGVGTVLHLAGELYSKITGAKMVHVPYKGLVPALTDLQAGNIDIAFANIANVRPFLEGGRTKALVVTDVRPSKALAGLPTTSDLGMPQLAFTTWYGVMAPAKTPDSVVKILETAFSDTIKDPAVIEMFDAQGIDAAGDPSSAYFGALIKRDYDIWIPLIKDLGIKPQ